jgi:thiol:disulfide interchange protein
MVLLWAHAEWNLASLELKRGVWADPRVRRAAQAVAVGLVDLSEATPDNEERMVVLGIERIPTVLLQDAEGRELGRIDGAITVEAVLALLVKAAR